MHVNDVKVVKDEKIKVKNMNLEKILKRYEIPFQNDLFGGLPPKISVDHGIEIED